jgi:hypothetical protein
MRTLDGHMYSLCRCANGPAPCRQLVVLAKMLTVQQSKVVSGNGSGSASVEAGDLWRLEKSPTFSPQGALKGS